MKFLHNSRLLQFRTPFGAVEAGCDVHLSVIAEEVDPSAIDIDLRLWVDGAGETLIPMVHEGDGIFAVTLPCPEPKLIWYRFNVRQTTDGIETLRYLGAPEGRTGGQAMLYEYEECPSFQITVYRHRATRPSWYERGMVYQIFPDRYRRDPDWKRRCTEALKHQHKGIPRNLIEDWDEPPSYKRAEDGSILEWDMYGGSLKGITADLDRLQELGITAIYLNPVFEASSNHRYDTADYMKIDPMLGSEDDFKELCREAKTRGISIILDGVFNHTGDDSIYFNRYGTYPGAGAWQGDTSPWREAYEFNEDGSYHCWWGIDNMPDFNQSSPIVRNLILGRDGVIRRWTRAGAHGWRLDVADELQESLIEEIREVLLDECPDALLLGEVWEDASNKISYGMPRHYLLGSELDSAMNYPFRDMVLGFLLGTSTVEAAVETIESLSENYPHEALCCALNLLGSHDRPRIASLLGGGPDESNLPECERGRWRLSAESMGLAKSRFWLATLMQMTFPGVPSIYYGDEFCLEGLSDPGNRRTMPLMEDIRDRDMETIIRNASALRRTLPLMIDGTIRAFVPEGSEGDVLAYERQGTCGESAIVLINRNMTCARGVRIAAAAACATDVISGSELVPDAGGMVEFKLWPLGSAVIYFHDERRIQRPLAAGAGVVCHVTSVPNAKGHPGTLGDPAKRFIDHLARMGMRYWQLLPINPTDPFGSPYSGPSAFAGSIALLPESEEELRLEHRRWKATGGYKLDSDYRAFKERHAAWLKPYCAFMAIKAYLGDDVPRTAWPAPFSRFDEKLLADPRLAEEVQVQAYLQYRFDMAWREIRDYARRRRVSIIGDIPMYVSNDSSDVWATPELFNLGAAGEPAYVAGAPADGFTPDGQVWGNPTYRWDAIADSGYAWWTARLKRAFDLYDYVRLDHFVGFYNYFSIPADMPASAGRWIVGPGFELFEHAHRELGPLPCIAEDLGVLTPGVRSLMARCGFPGMDVLVFEDYDVRLGLHPHPGKVFYTSTHDTETLTGFCERALCEEGDEEGAQKLAATLIEDALASPASVVMMPLQDVLGLGNDARMNMPGTTEGNWSWQADEEALASVEEHMADLMRACARSA